MENQSLTIGQLAERSGCSVQIVRHYEQEALLPEPPRTAGNQRRYDARHLQRLQFIRHSRDLGFSLQDIREMARLSDQPGQSCQAVDAIARQHLDDVERRISQLQALRKELKRMVGECRNGRISECRIIETLADFNHGHCLNDDHDGALTKVAVPKRRR